jgi:hypothetical protein
VVIDATATQFGFDCPDVVVGTHRELERRYGAPDCWEVGLVTERENELNAAIDTWDDTQQPACVLEAT